MNVLPVSCLENQNDDETLSEQFSILLFVLKKLIYGTINLAGINLHLIKKNILLYFVCKPTYILSNLHEIK